MCFFYSEWYVNTFEFLEIIQLKRDIFNKIIQLKFGNVVFQKFVDVVNLQKFVDVVDLQRIVNLNSLLML